MKTEKTLFKEIQKAYYDALSAQEKYRSTRKAVYANSEALRYAWEKYNAGKFTAYEYNEIKLKCNSIALTIHNFTDVEETDILASEN
ncbi:MAG: TolC family protein [Tannerellaceae bacterium]|jgi:hypothetical protein|nr:TolC family protein [Tannerellaceae bacterium]